MSSKKTKFRWVFRQMIAHSKHDADFRSLISMELRDLKNCFNFYRFSLIFIAKTLNWNKIAMKSFEKTAEKKSFRKYFFTFHTRPISQHVYGSYSKIVKTQVSVQHVRSFHVTIWLRILWWFLFCKEDVTLLHGALKKLLTSPVIM